MHLLELKMQGILTPTLHLKKSV